MSYQPEETGFRVGADGKTYYTGTGTRTRKARFQEGFRRFGGVTRRATSSGARGAYRLGRGVARTTSKYATGLDPQELSEYRRLLAEERRGTFTRDETYLYEVHRLNELEKRYRQTTGLRKAQLLAAYRRAKYGPPKRLRA